MHSILPTTTPTNRLSSNHHHHQRSSYGSTRTKRSLIGSSSDDVSLSCCLSKNYALASALACLVCVLLLIIVATIASVIFSSTDVSSLETAKTEQTAPLSYDILKPSIMIEIDPRERLRKMGVLVGSDETKRATASRNKQARNINHSSKVAVGGGDKIGSTEKRTPAEPR